jgi:hypothetical protein
LLALSKHQRTILTTELLAVSFMGPISLGIGAIALTLWFLGRAIFRNPHEFKTKSLTRQVTEPTSLRTSKDGHSTVAGGRVEIQTLSQ